jgi:hypothetical protein
MLLIIKVLGVKSKPMYFFTILSNLNWTLLYKNLPIAFILSSSIVGVCKINTPPGSNTLYISSKAFLAQGHVLTHLTLLLK